MSYLQGKELDFLKSGCLISDSTGLLWLGIGVAERSSRPIMNRLSIFSPDFFLEDEKPWYCFSEYTKGPASALLEVLRDLPELSRPCLNRELLQPEISKEPDFEIFRQIFLNAKDQFCQSDCSPEFSSRSYRNPSPNLSPNLSKDTLKKVVPVFFETAKFKWTLAALASRLNNLLTFTNGWPLYPYGLWDDQKGILGATPETLFEMRDSTFYTMALAGTRLKSLSEKESLSKIPLLEDRKEREEHQWVIDGIYSSLNQMSGQGPNQSLQFQNLNIGQTQELELPRLIHLLTPISFQVKKNDLLPAGDLARFKSGGFHQFDDGPGELPVALYLSSKENLFNSLIQALHPTPALGSFPKQKGMEWLRHAEKQVGFSRKRFGAPFGAIFPNDSCSCYVAIRNVEWDASSYQVGAGCGLISASQLDNEWKEVLGKIQSTKQILGIEGA